MRKLSAFLLFVLVCHSEKLPLRRYTTADGLAGNRVEWILSDSRGFLWFATTEGLSRFDGYEFKNFTPEQGLPGSYVTQIIETRSGSYWIGTNRGPCRFNPSQSGSRSRFTPYGIGARGATTIMEDRSGAIWCGSFSGLFRLMKGGATFEPVDIGMPLARGGDDAIVSALLEDRQGTVWVGAGNALYRRTPDSKTYRYTDRDGLPPHFGFVEAMMEDREGQIWIATRAGLCRTVAGPSPKGLAIARIYGTRDGLLGNGRTNGWTNSLLQASDGKLWAGAGTLHLYTGEKGSPAVFREYNTAHGLAEGSVEALAEDQAGNLWIGTDGNGVMKITRNGFVRFGEHDGVAATLDSIFESRRGELCVIAEERRGRALSRMVEWFDGRRFIPVRPAFPASIRYFGWSASQVGFQDHAGEWWFATGQGVCRFPRTDGVAGLANLRPKAVYSARDGLPSDDVFRIFEDSRGDIWIGTQTGLARWERATESFHQLPEVPDTVTAFGEDREGDLWVGTFHGWLGRVRDGHWSPISGFAPGQAGMIGSIHRDHAGRLWVGTNGPGLFRFDHPTQPQPSPTRYTTREGLSSIRIAAVTEDRQGRIWVSTARGVDSLDVSANGISGIQHFSTADGLAEGEGRVAFCDRSGALWFDMQHGLSRLIPHARDVLTPPAVLVTGVRVNGAAFPISDLGETQLRLPNLPPRQNHIQIEFGGFQFAAGETLRYQFGITDNDSEWGPPVTGRSVNYAALRPGSYRFRVRAINSAGRTSEKPAVVSFEILPPFWQRWWFATLAAVLSASLLYVAYRYRLEQMIKLERVRTRIATDLHDDIGASLSQIAVLSEVAWMDAGRGTRAQEPLSRIASISRDVVDSMSEIVWAVNPRKDRLCDLAQHMREYAGDVFVARNISFRFDTSGTARDQKLGMEARRQLFLIFKECLHNIVRHSGCTQASVELTVVDDWLILRVTDNGRGFDPAIDAKARPARGHGLENMCSRARSLGGRLETIATPGGGVTTVLHIPLPHRLRSWSWHPPKWSG